MYGAIIGDIVGSIYYDEMTWPEVKEAANASREVTLQTDSLCATFSWWSMLFIQLVIPLAFF